MNSPQLTLAQIASAILRHKGKCLLVFLLVMMLVTAAFVIWPRMYGSEGRIFVQVGRQDTNVSPTSSVGVSIQDTRETEIRSVTEIIKSRAVIEAVVDNIGSERILASPLDKWMPSLSMPKFLSSGKASSDGMTKEEFERLKKRELAAKKIESSMSVYAEKKTSVISVYAKASSARLAQEIVSSIFEETKKIHLQVHAVKGSTVFFEDKIRECEATLNSSLAVMRDFRNKNKFLSVENARATLHDIVSDLEKDILTTEIELAKDREMVRHLQAEMGKTERQVAVETVGVERKSGDDARVSVFNLQAERERLLSTYNESHPDDIRIEKQLAKMQQNLNYMADDRTQMQMQMNPVYDDIKVDLIRAQAAAVGSTARLGGLKEKLSDAQVRLVELNQAEVETDKLARNISTARRDHELYLEKGIEAKANSSLDQSNISGLVVAQEPNFVVKHVSPKGKLFMPVGAMLGILCGLFTALFFERNHLSGSLNESEVEQILEMPVLVTLPRVYSSRNMVN